MNINIYILIPLLVFTPLGPPHTSQPTPNPSNSPTWTFMSQIDRQIDRKTYAYMHICLYIHTHLNIDSACEIKLVLYTHCSLFFPFPPFPFRNFLLLTWSPIFLSSVYDIYLFKSRIQIRKKWHLSFYSWLTSLNMKISSFIRFPKWHHFDI